MKTSRLPIRWRVAIWSVVMTGAVLLIFGLGTLVVLYHEQVEGIDAAINGEARFLVRQAERDNADVADPQELAVAFPKWIDVAVFDANGNLLSRTRQLPEALARSALATSKIRTVHQNGRTWRIRSLVMGKRHIVLAHDLGDAGDVVEDLSSAYLISMPFALLLAAAAGWWVAASSLHPISALAGAAETITAEKLGTRLPVPPAKDEIARLASVLNEVLDRLERSFNQARNFAADASHELRTPLTIMRGEIEQALRQGGLLPEQERRLVSLLEETARLDRITEHLLLLARFDAGEAPLQRQPMDFSALVVEAAEDAFLLATERALTIETAIAPGLWVNGDPAHLRRLLLNLLDNATKFNGRDGRVSCALKSTSTGLRLSIGNTGPGVPEDQRGRLFERFFQGDGTHARVNRGQGLGLSLCREIVRAHGGDIRLAKAEPGWTEFAVILPTVPAPLAAVSR